MGVLENLLIFHSYLPPYPGKARIYDRLASDITGVRTRKRYGVLFQCDLADKVAREIYWTGFQMRDSRILRRLIKPGMVVMDVGANIGYYSLLFAKWLHGSGHAYCFEPFPQTAAKWRNNLKLNPSLQATLEPVALSDFSGLIEMEMPDNGNLGCNYITEQSGSIPVTTLDIWATGLSRLDFIKVDIEGSECKFLGGAENTLKKFRPQMMIEVNESTLSRFGSSSAELIEKLRSLGYSLFISDRFGFRLKPLSRIPVFGEEPNVFCLPTA